MALTSGFGQTFFISLFNPEIRQTFSLSHGEIGSLYFAGTLASAIAVVFLGKLIDNIHIRYYTLFVTVGLSLACITMAKINSVIALTLAFFLLRLFGQGLSGHTGITTVSRVAANFRGRSVSLAGLGFSTAEIILPTLTLALVSYIGWRQTWFYYGVGVLICITLITQLLIPKLHLRHKTNTDAEPEDHSWNRSQVVRDKRFWKIAPALFSPPIISTALVFHQQSLALSKAFTLNVWAAGIAAYSIAAVLTSLLTGVLVDRYSGIKIVKLFLLPFISALLVAIFVTTAFLPFIYYALIGMTVGIAMPSISALWLELYGPAHIGSIRSLTHALMVFGSALGPVIVGLLIDWGTSWNTILIGFVVYMTLATGIMLSTKLERLNNTRADTL